MRLFVTTENKDTCFFICNQLDELDISVCWDEKSHSGCGFLSVKGEDGITHLHYILLKDAADTTLEYEGAAAIVEQRGIIKGPVGDKLLSGSESPLGKPSSMSLTIYQPANFSMDIVEEEKRTK
ncbi:hypothetical protein Tco_1139747 [Tanacetum coccineum]